MFYTLLNLQVHVWQQLFCGKKAFCNFSQPVVLWFCTSSVSGQFSVIFVTTLLTPNCASPTNSLQLSKVFTQEKLKSSVDTLFSNRSCRLSECKYVWMQAFKVLLSKFMGSYSISLETLNLYFILSILVLFLLCWLVTESGRLLSGTRLD